MKIKGFTLFVCLMLVSGVSAQVADTVNSTKKNVTVLKPKTQAEVLAEKVKKLKITPQNLVDVKEAVKPALNTAGIPTDAKDVLVFVDGKETPMAFYKTMDPLTLSSISVVKNLDAIKMLTTKKCSMAIVVTTKKKATAK
jgi:hypothetical protein